MYTVSVSGFEGRDPLLLGSHLLKMLQQGRHKFAQRTLKSARKLFLPEQKTVLVPCLRV